MASFHQMLSAASKPAVSAGRTDNFTRANETPLATPSDGGSNWVQTFGNNIPKLVSNFATNNGAFNASYGHLVGSSNILPVSATFTVGGSGDKRGLISRVPSLNNWAIFFQWDGTQWKANKNVSATQTDIETPTSANPPASGDTLSISWAGNVYTCKCNSTVIFTNTDASIHTAATGSGIYLSSTADATCKASNFAGS